MIIRIQDDLVKYTNFRDTIDIDCKNIGDGIARLMDRYPQLYVFLLGNDGAEAKAVSIKLDGEFVWHPDTGDKPCTAETELIFGREVPQGEGAKSGMWLGAGLLVLAALSGPAGWAAAGSWLATNAGMIALAGAGMLLQGAFAPKLEMPGITDSLGGSAAHSFSGVKNTTAAGTPIQLVYGEHRVGGQLLNVFTEFSDPNQQSFVSWAAQGKTHFVQVMSTNNTGWSDEYIEHLYAQVAQSEGEIQGATAIEVNGLPVTYFNDVAVPEVRTGTLAQEPMEWFSRIENTTGGIGTLLTPASYAPVESLTSEIEFPVYGFADVPTHTIKYSGRGQSPTNDTEFRWVRDHCSIKTGPYLTVTPYALSGQSAIIPGKFTAGKYELCSDNDPAKTVLLWDFYTEAILAGKNPDNIQEGTGAYTGYAVRKVASTGVSTLLTLTSGAVVHETEGACEGFKVTITAPALYASDSHNAPIETTVEVTVAYRVAGSTDPWIVAVHKDRIRGKTASEVARTYTVGANTTEGIHYKLPLAYYEIAVIRETPEAEDSFKTRDLFYLKDVTELTFQALAYPHTALLGIKVKATDQLSGQMPTITSMVKGVKVAIPSDRAASDGVTGEIYYNRDYSGAPWDGKLSTNLEFNWRTKVWTDNPVWCLYDLLTNTRYGLGNFYKIDPNKRGLMLANFYLMAKYCDELITRPDANGVPEQVPRFRLNIVIDQSKQAAEWVQIICAAMRASWNYSGGIFTLDIDRAKPITQIFNMTTLREFTTTGASLRAVPNTYEVQYPNPAKSFTIDTFRVEDAVLLADASLEERKAALQLIGVTDRRQCHSLARYALDSGRTLTKMVSFKTDRRAVYSQVGDVIGVQHDVPQWGFGGVIEVIDEVTGALTLSADFLPEAGLTYSMSLVSSSGQLSVNTAITFVDEEVVTEVLPAAVFTTDPLVGAVDILIPRVGDRYVIGTLPVNPFRITMIKEDRDGLFELNCIQYNGAIYAAADAIYDAPTEAVPDYSLLVPVTQDPVSGVSARVKTYLDGAGILKNGIEVFYSPPYNKANWAGCTLYYSQAGGGAFSTKPISSSGYFFIEEVITGTYTLILPSTWKDGAQQSLNEALNDYSNHPFTTLKVEFLQDLIDSPEVDWAIRGLQIENKGNSEEFTGKDCIITWRRPRLLGQNEAAGEEGGTDTSNWITGYLVEVLNPNGTVRRSSTVTAPRFIYSLEMNHQDGIARSFLLRVTTIGSGGNFSAPAMIAVNNPSPAPVTGVVAEGLVAAYRVAFDPSPELDVVGYKVYVSTVLAEIDVEPGVAIEEAFLINKGPETSFSVPAAVGGAYYLRVAAYDTFGEVGLNYSPVYAANVTAEIPHFLALFEEQLSENQLNTTLNERINLIDDPETGLVARAAGWDDSLGDLGTQYTVKIDNNGFMTGFGLSSEAVDGVPFSQFIISADRLAMIDPAGIHFTISSITRDGSVMTVETTFAHGLGEGDHCVVTGCAEHEYNGTWKIVSVPMSTQLTVTITTTPVTPATLKDPLKPLQLWAAVVPFLVEDGKTFLDSALVNSIKSTILYGGYPAWEFDREGLFTMRNTDGSVLMQAGVKLKLANIEEYSALPDPPTSVTAPTMS